MASLPLVIGVVTQRFGEIVAQTRLERVLDPLRAVSETLHLWDPSADMGSLPNQAVGYLLSFDPPFVVGNLLGLAPWVTERLVIAAVLVAALWGFVRLVDAFDIGSPVTRIIGGLAFALSPVVLSRVGWRLPEAVAPALLPLILLPLVRATREGSPRRAAARSGLVVVLVGGANAVVTFAVLVVPVLYLLTRARGPRRARLTGWWLFSVMLATTWWLVGLPFLNRYGADLLSFTESVEATTAPTTLFNTLRGSADWLVGLDGGTYAEAASAMAQRALPLLGIGVFTAVGLAGLTSRTLRDRRFLVASFAVGVAVVGGAYGTWLGNPLADPYRQVLGGPLEPLRNIYKFAGLILLPVAIGFTHALSLALRHHAGQLAPRRSAVSDRLRTTAPAVGVVVVSVVVLAASAFPLITGVLTRGPGFVEEPASWIEAKTWLDAEATGRVLVVPGQSEASYTWGRTSQLPLEWGTDVTWATRSQLPLSGPPAIAVLDAVELAIERGGSSLLPSFLARAGFSHVLVPNDSVAGLAGLAAPERVAAALESSGLERVVGFGDDGFGFGNLRQLDVYAVADSARVAAYGATSAGWLSGDAESVLEVPVSEFGERAWVLTRDEAPPSLPLENWLITDGNQRVAIDVGLHRLNRSGVLGVDDMTINGDLVDERRLFRDRLDYQTTLEYDGIEQVTASSVGPGPLLRASPGAQPANVLDGDPDTAWFPVRERTGGAGQWGDEDPWVAVRFDQPRPVDPLGIQLALGPYWATPQVIVSVTTDNGSVATVLEASKEPQRLNAPAGPSSFVQVSIDRGSLREGGDWLGVAELDLPGPPVNRWLRVPAELTAEFSAVSANAPAWVFTRNKPSSSPASSVNTESALQRRFVVPRPLNLDFRAWGSVGDGAALIDGLARSGSLRVNASAQFGDKLAFAARNAIDTDPSTLWRTGTVTAADRTTSAWLALSWDEERVLDRFVIDVPADLAIPSWVLVSMGGETRVAPVGPNGEVQFAALRGSSVIVAFIYPEHGDAERSQPIGVAGLDIPALTDLAAPPIDLTAPVTITCGDGLTVVLAGRTVRLTATVPLEQLAEGTTFPLTSCDPAPISLPAGEVDLVAAQGPLGVTVDKVVLGTSPLLSTQTGERRDISVLRWDSTQRAVSVGPGSAAVVATTETFNAGWEASLDGQALDAVQVDGWRQAFVVPAGSGGTLEMVFGPNQWFTVGLWTGAMFVVALIVVALIPARRVGPPAVAEGQWWPPLMVLGAVLTAIWVTGMGAVALVPLWWMSSRWRSVLGWVAGVAFILAAGITIVARRSTDPWESWWVPGSVPVAMLSVVAFIAVLASVLPHPYGRRRSE